MRPAEVDLVPLTIGLVASDTLLAYRSVGKQVVDELDWEYLNFIILFETTHIDVVTLCNIQKDTIDEEEEGLNIEELTPTQAQIKEELS